MFTLFSKTSCWDFTNLCLCFAMVNFTSDYAHPLPLLHQQNNLKAGNRVPKYIRNCNKNRLFFCKTTRYRTRVCDSVFKVFNIWFPCWKHVVKVITKRLKVSIVIIFNEEDLLKYAERVFQLNALLLCSHLRGFNTNCEVSNSVSNNFIYVFSGKERRR